MLSVPGTGAGPMAVAKPTPPGIFKRWTGWESSADICPRATGHIPEQLGLIEKMIEAGLTYEVNGSVYFDVSKDPEYGKLVNRSFEEMQEEPRSRSAGKTQPPGLALWKKAGADTSCAGGIPTPDGGIGWHTECPVMSTRYLGILSISTAGNESISHHDCEISQAKDSTAFAGADAQQRYHRRAEDEQIYRQLRDPHRCLQHVCIRYFIAASHYRSVVTTAKPLNCWSLAETRQAVHPA